MEEKGNRSGSLVNGMNGVLNNIQNGIAAKKSFFKGFLGSRGRERELSGKGSASGSNNAAGEQP